MTSSRIYWIFIALYRQVGPELCPARALSTGDLGWAALGCSGSTPDRHLWPSRSGILLGTSELSTPASPPGGAYLRNTGSAEAPGALEQRDTWGLGTQGRPARLERSACTGYPSQGSCPGAAWDSPRWADLGRQEPTRSPAPEVGGVTRSLVSPRPFARTPPPTPVWAESKDCSLAPA